MNNSMAKKPKAKLSNRESTIKNRQDAMKEKVILKLEEYPVVQIAVSNCGVDRSTYYRWTQTDPEFKKLALKAIDKGKDLINDMMESLLVKKAMEGHITAIIYWLKNNHLNYSERLKHEYEINLKQETLLSPERIKEIAEELKPEVDELYDNAKK